MQRPRIQSCGCIREQTSECHSQAEVLNTFAICWREAETHPASQISVAKTYCESCVLSSIRFTKCSKLPKFKCDLPVRINCCVAPVSKRNGHLKTTTASLQRSIYIYNAAFRYISRHEDT